MSGKGPRTQLPAGPLDKANMCPQVPILLMTSSSNQRCGPPEGSKPHVPGWLQSPLEDEKILYLMIIHFDYTSALGSMVLFFCNVWERSISGYWSLPIRNQCCDIITFLHLGSRWIINEQVAEAPIANRGNISEGCVGGWGGGCL